MVCCAPLLLMQIALFPSNTAAMLNCGSPGWRVLGQAVLVYLAIASSAASAEDSQPGRGTLAEMVAFARLGSVACPRLAPDVEGFYALALLGLSNHHSRAKRLPQKKRRLNVVEIVSALTDGAGSMPAKWSRRVFWLRSYEGKISCDSFELGHGFGGLL